MRREEEEEEEEEENGAVGAHPWWLMPVRGWGEKAKAAVAVANWARGEAGEAATATANANANATVGPSPSLVGGGCAICGPLRTMRKRRGGMWVVISAGPWRRGVYKVQLRRLTGGLVEVLGERDHGSRMSARISYLGIPS